MRDDHSHHNPRERKDNDANQHIKVVVNITWWVDEKDLGARYQQAQICRLGQIMITKGLKLVTGPTMASNLQALHIDPIVMQLKIATIMVPWILMDFERLVYIISFTYLKKLWLII